MTTPISKNEVEEIVHICGCAVGNLDPQADDYIERVEEFEAEAVKEITLLLERRETEAYQKGQIDGWNRYNEAPYNPHELKASLNQGGE